MKKILTVLLGLSLFGCSSKANYHQIDGQSALDMMNNETDYIIIDVRTESEYQQGHIKNAINIPNESIDESNLCDTIEGICGTGNKNCY